VDLSSDTYKYGKYLMWHGAQFRGMLADQRKYWIAVMGKMGLPVSQQ
jgi:hypothetical protein